MKTTLHTRRILLDEAAAEQLNQMMATLRTEGSHLTLVPSRLVSAILIEYATRHFPREKGRIVDTLFNRKSFLKAMMGGLKSGNDEEIKALEATLRELRAGRTGKLASTAQETKPEALSKAIES